MFAAWLLLAFTHEGALVLLLTIAATLAPRGLRSATFVRAAISLRLLRYWPRQSKIIQPPDDYYADAFLRAALHFFEFEIFKVRVVLLLLAAVIAYGAILMLFSIWIPRRACTVRSGDFARIAFHLLAASRSFRACEQPLLSADRAGHRHALAWRDGGLCRLDQGRNRFQSMSEAARHPDLAPWRDAVRSRLGFCRGDLDPCDRNREIRRVMDRLPRRNRGAGDEQRIPTQRSVIRDLSRRSGYRQLSLPCRGSRLSLIFQSFSRTSRRTGWSSIPLEITSGYPAERQQGTRMQKLPFRCRPASWSGLIRACIDKPATMSRDGT